VVKKQSRQERKGGRELWNGERIKEIREARKLTRRQLADKALMSEDDLGRHERNDHASNPAVDVLMRIARALHVPSSALFDPKGAPIPGPEQQESGHDREQGVAVLEKLRLNQLDEAAPAEDSTRGDILRAQHALNQAQAALNRALLRPDTKSGAA
jgi:transcriptional regulator with XRE-family HTH domain